MSLPPSLEQNPRLADWIRFEGERLVVHTGKVELGQGIRTAIAMIAAEEFDIETDSISVLTGSTLKGPNEFITAGSMSVEMSGAAVRQAAAEVRHHLLGIAASRFGCDREALTVDAGMVYYAASNRVAAWHELASDLDPGLEAKGDVATKPVADYTRVGTTTTRIDLPGKFTGEASFIQDIREPDQRYGRIVRPPSQAHRLEALDAAEVEAMPDVEQVVIDGSFIGVIARTDRAASLARTALAASASWRVDSERQLPRGDIFDFLRSAPRVSLPVIDGTPSAEVPIPAKQPASLEVVYKKPYHMHGSIGPSAAVAHFDGTRLHIKSHSQGPSILQHALASALDLPPEQVAVEHVENAGCYGHNGADDAAMDAALLALAMPEHWIMLKWEREDEHRFEPLSPAMTLEMAATLNDGKVTWWSADVYSQTHSGRPRPRGSVTNLLAAWHRDPPYPRAESRPAMGHHVGIHRNADPVYDFPDRRIVKHLVTDQRVRTSSTRGLGAFGNVFAIESFIDELAAHAGIDPVAFRLNHLSDERARAVIERANAVADSYTQPQHDRWRSGRGMAFARYKNKQTYAAVVYFVAVDERTFSVRLDHAVIAADAGLVIDRDGLANQLEGGLIQASSWTMIEQVTFDEFGTAASDWETYPILRFSDMPTVDVEIIDRTDQPSLGAGEATQGPTPAAIKNAIYDATGLRVRQIPFTPDRLRAVALGET